jgi:hypothetical protein
MCSFPCPTNPKFTTHLSLLENLHLEISLLCSLRKLLKLPCLVLPCKMTGFASIDQDELRLNVGQPIFFISRNLPPQFAEPLLHRSLVYLFLLVDAVFAWSAVHQQEESPNN